MALALAFPAVCFHWVSSALRARLYILAAPFVKDTSFPRGTWEKRVFCVGRGNECLFFFSRMQKTNKSSENSIHYIAFGFYPLSQRNWHSGCFCPIIIAISTIRGIMQNFPQDIADICHNRHNRPWCTFFKPVPCLIANLCIFWCTFTGLNNAVVSQNWQLSGMPQDYQSHLWMTVIATCSVCFEAHKKLM